MASAVPTRLRPPIALASLLLLLGLFLAVARYGPETSLGRQWIVGQLNGLDLGSVGHLGVEGLTGDPWTHPRLARVTISDKAGVWLDARDVDVRWRPSELGQRRVRLTSVAARSVTLLRRPQLAKAKPGGSAPVSIEVDRAATRVAMTPAFAQRRGVYDVDGSIDLERSGAASARFAAASLLHRGDRLELDFAMGRDHRFSLDGVAREAQGGAMAGALGLAANQPFLVTAHAKGSPAAGSISVDTRLGQTRPFVVDGNWNGNRGQGHADIDLAASTLLAGYRGMLGPAVHLEASGKATRGGLSAIDLTGVAENARVSVRGVANIATLATGPLGLVVQAQMPSANRLLGFPTMGALAVVGRLNGDRQHWVFTGGADVNNLSEGPYRLARLRGPVQVENQGSSLVIAGQPVGEGGAGEGLLAALLGSRPNLAGEVTRLADGRWLLRKLALTGPGIAVNGQGSVGILGDLAFAGKARFANLAMAHRGANGVVTADWTASQAGKGPWTFAVDAKGENFAAGLAEADRLLGRSPRFATKASYAGDMITFTDWSLAGAAGSARGSGVLGPKAGIAIKLAWQAKGPFVIGPLEIDGAASGSGDIGGTLAAPRADLAAQFATLAAPGLAMRDARLHVNFQPGPGGPDGRFAVNAASDYGPASAASAFRFIDGGVALSGLDLKAGGLTAAGAITLTNAQPSSADLTLTAGPGAFLTQGHADGRLKIVGSTAALSLTAAEAVVRESGLAIKTLDLSAAGPLDRLPFKLSANGPSAGGPWRLRGAGELTRQGEDRLATFSGTGLIRRAEFKTLTPARVDIGPKGLTAAASVSAGGGRADLAFANLAGAANLKARLEGVDLALLNEDYIGKVSAEANLAGRGDQLSGAFDARLAGAGGRDLRGAPPIDGEVSGRLADRALQVSFHLGNSRGFRAGGDLAVPMRVSAAPFTLDADYHRPLRGRLQINGEIKPFWDLAVVRGGADSLAGQASADITLGGTLSDPRASGQVSLDNGRFQDEDTGLRLEKVSLRATLTGDAVDVSQFAGVDGAKGQITGSGRASLLRDGASTFRAEVRNFQLLDTDLARATASGAVTVNRAADGKVQIAGALTIDKAQISPNPPAASGAVPMDVIEIHRPDALDDTPTQMARTSAKEAPVALDVAIRAPGGVFLKGRGLNVELALNAHVGGTIASPILSGQARVVRGDYDFAGQRFRLDDTGVIWLASTPQAIRLDLRATREDPSLTAMIRIGGAAAKPTITLTSSPSLPQDEILSRVLFGTSVSQLSGIEAAQLASAIAGHSGGGGFDLIGGLRSLAHLDRLAFASTALGAATVSGGKYITDRLYLQLTGGGGREGEAAQLEWRVNRKLSLVGKLGTLGDSQVSIRWRHSY